MKAITLYQPWAEMVARGFKRYETRSWTTKYRGPLAIHASRSSVEAMRFRTEPFMRLMGGPSVVDSQYFLGDRSFGGVVAVVNLVDVSKSAEAAARLNYIVDNDPDLETRSRAADELALGDYSPGRFAWELELLFTNEHSPLVRGYQRIWNLPEPVAMELYENAAAAGTGLP